MNPQTNEKEQSKSISRQSSTYESQTTLPRLPIPSLEQTLEKFLYFVKPLLTPSQYQDTLSQVSKFKSQDGPTLQTILQEYESSTKFGSYIEEWWSDAYLAPNSSVVLNLNPFFLLEDDPDSKISKSQIGRAARLAFHSLRLAASLKNQKMKADEFRGTTLCMDQFLSLFGSARIPNVERDVVEVDVDSDHVVVLYRHQFYYFRALWPTNGEEEVTVAVSEGDIVEILQSIVKDGQQTSTEESVQNAIGVLTTLQRDEWAKARYQLVQSSETNKSSLGVIDSALFVLVLDDYFPKDVHDAAANMLHGTHTMNEVEEDKKNQASGRELRYSFDKDLISSKAVREYQSGTCCNRWYDKLQIIVCSDGSSGINFEHSAIDGHTALRFASDVYAETVVQFAKSITKSIYTAGCPIPSMIDADVIRASSVNSKDKNGNLFETSPKKLHFELIEKVKDRIFHAEAALGDAINADDTFVLEFEEFGKNFIVANKMSPDSVVQMSILLAYYKLYGEIVCAYEPVLTKKFFHGRTEAMRSTTNKTVELCKCWTNRLASKDEKLNALREATKNHSRLVREASEGHGVDRHLYAMKCLAEKKGLEIPEFFKCDGYNALNHTVLSTSNCGNPALRLFGFGPVVPDGFGVGYIIKDSRLQYSISSKHRQTKRFASAIREVLHELGQMLEPINTQPVGYHNVVKKKSPKSKRSSLVEYAEGWDDTYGEKSPFSSRSSLVGVTKVTKKSFVRQSSSSIGKFLCRK
ncbi:hypothetical protein CTEN210_06472 [Chaetoceros tenuissimus]|uniref:Choline/carnitine acyltransferase domain-containing protein n=1 Tax=Chaetoceros tenuissimus TaxID=426638 RepID=A0AAD3H4H1_9STRA|nr:hypothetical protein CTEN210_06472 [Chaetoceros tenuissimus]